MSLAHFDGRPFRRPIDMWGAAITTATLAAGATRYSQNGNQGHGGTIGLQELPVPFNCRLRNLRAEINGVAGVGETITFTVMIDGAPSALTVTIGGAADTYGEDLVNTVDFAAGQDFVMQHVTSGAAATRYPKWTLEVVPL